MSSKNDGDPFLRPGGIFGKTVNLHQGELPPMNSEGADMSEVGAMVRALNNRSLLKKDDGTFTEISQKFGGGVLDTTLVQIGESFGMPIYGRNNNNKSPKTSEAKSLDLLMRG